MLTGLVEKGRAKCNDYLNLVNEPKNISPFILMNTQTEAEIQMQKYTYPNISFRAIANSVGNSTNA